jgi:hypothetical protein
MMKFITTIFTIFSILIASSHQQTVTVPEDGDAVEFVVQVERVAPAAGGHNTFIGVGTLLTFQHVMTTRTIYDTLQVPQDVALRFRSQRIGDGFTARPTGIVFHTTADLAIARLAHRVDQQFSFAPRSRAVLPQNRFCSMFGFNLAQTGINAQQMVMTAAVVRSGATFCGTNPLGPFCVAGVANQFPTCNGFAGAPITCDGNTVSGMVVRDNLCAAVTPRVYLIAVSEFQVWIDEQTSGVRGIFGGMQVVLGVLGVVFVRVFV